MIVLLKIDSKDLEILKPIIDRHRYDSKWRRIVKGYTEAKKQYGKLILKNVNS